MTRQTDLTNQLAEKIASISKGIITAEQAQEIASQHSSKLVRYVDGLGGTVEEWAQKYINNEIASRTAIAEFMPL